MAGEHTDQGHVSMQVTNAGGTVSAQGPAGAPEVFDTAPAQVAVKLGMTCNMGDYESLKVEVMVTLPCKGTAEDLEHKANWAKQFCERKVQEIVKENSAV